MSADLHIGTVLNGSAASAMSEPASAVLDATRFNRHTFWCGQSGSGKTYALGVVLEQLLIETQLQIVVIDPNADFVGLGQPREGADATASATIAATDVRVLNSTSPDGDRLHVRYIDMNLRSKAAVLQLDPIADAEEYNVLLQLEAEIGAQEIGAVLSTLRDSPDAGRRRLAKRIENLGLLDWTVWAFRSRSAEDIIDAGARATVMDVGGFATVAEARVAALAVLDHLWAQREKRRPLLIVIDEAHNLCSPDPITPIQKALTERIVQIAAEGRKFGLWMLLSTQRPSKIHPNVLSQCDNLGLMRMSSPRDLAELGQVFGFAPAELLSRSPRFAQGQALFAGGFVREPSLVQMRDRITREGGADVRVPIL